MTLCLMWSQHFTRVPGVKAVCIKEIMSLSSLFIGSQQITRVLKLIFHCIYWCGLCIHFQIFDKEDPEAQLVLKNALSRFHYSLDELYEMFHIF